MRKITVEGIEINFNDLTEQKQRKLYEKNKEKYKEDASKSIYSGIRSMVAKDEKESSKLLNRMLRDEINGKSANEVLNQIYDNKIFEIEKESIITLSTSVWWNDRIRAAELSKDSKFLNQMLRREMKWLKNVFVKEAILDNKFFEIEDETIEVLDAVGIKKATLLKDPYELLEMFINELRAERISLEVLEAIIGNESFVLEKAAVLNYIRDNY